MIKYGKNGKYGYALVGMASTASMVSKVSMKGMVEYG